MIMTDTNRETISRQQICCYFCIVLYFGVVMAKPTTPIPVHFKSEETEFLRRLNGETGFPVAEIVRRSVRHLQRSVDSTKTPEQRSHLILQLHA